MRKQSREAVYTEICSATKHVVNHSGPFEITMAPEQRCYQRSEPASIVYTQKGNLGDSFPRPPGSASVIMALAANAKFGLITELRNYAIGSLTLVRRSYRDRLQTRTERRRSLIPDPSGASDGPEKPYERCDGLYSSASGQKTNITSCSRICCLLFLQLSTHSTLQHTIKTHHNTSYLLKHD